MEFFYKISGRIYLKNAKSILRTKNKYRNEFIMYQGKKWCFTNIFKANKEDYLSVLNDVYLDCDEISVNDIEFHFLTDFVHRIFQWVDSIHIRILKGKWVQLREL